MFNVQFLTSFAVFTQDLTPDKNLKNLLQIELTCTAWKKHLESEEGHEVWRQLYKSLNPERFSFISKTSNPDTDWRTLAIEPFKIVVALISQVRRDAQLSAVDDEHPLFSRGNRFIGGYPFNSEKSIITRFPEVLEDQSHPILELLPEILKALPQLFAHLADRNEKETIVKFMKALPPLNLKDAYRIFFNSLHLQDEILRKSPDALDRSQFYHDYTLSSPSFPFGYLIFKYLMTISPVEELNFGVLRIRREEPALCEFRILAPMYGVPIQADTLLEDEIRLALLAKTFIWELISAKPFLLDLLEGHTTPWDEEIATYAKELGIEFSSNPTHLESSPFFDIYDSKIDQDFLKDFTYPDREYLDAFSGHRPLALAYQFNRIDLAEELKKRGAALKEGENITPHSDERIREILYYARDTRSLFGPL